MEGARRVIDHMNDDHAETLADYVRHHGGLNCCIENAEMTSISLESMSISYEMNGKSDSVTIMFKPPLAAASECRGRLVELAKKSAISRVPLPELAHIAGMLIIGISFPLLGILAYAPEVLPAPLRHLGALFLYSRTAMSAAFIVSVISHIFEGLYAAILVRRASGTLLHRRCVFWVSQALLFGYVSLGRLVHGLKRIEGKKKAV